MLKVGLFDSGIGGFSILGEIYKQIPKANYYYISDDAHSPYGEKEQEHLLDRCLTLTQDLRDKDIDLLVVACNTATAHSIEILRKKFPRLPIVGVEPYLNIIHHDAKLKNQKIGLLVTKATGESGRFYSLKGRLDPQDLIQTFVCPKLSELIEMAYYEGLHDGVKNLLRAELSELYSKDLDNLILGCTHYPLIQDFLEEELKLKCISPCESVAKRVKILLHENTKASESENPKLFFKSTKSDFWRENTFDSLHINDGRKVRVDLNC